MTKNVQQMRTTFPIGRSDDNNVITTNLRPGARLITLTRYTAPLSCLSNLSVTNMENFYSTHRIFIICYLHVQSVRVVYFPQQNMTILSVTKLLQNDQYLYK